MTSPLNAQQLAVRGTLQAAYAQSKKDTLFSALDDKIRNLSLIGMSSGRSGSSHEPSASIATRMSSDPSVHALMESCFLQQSTREQGVAHFQDQLVQSLSKNLATLYEGKSPEKAQKISTELMKIFDNTGAIENMWIRTKAMNEALSYQDGAIEVKYGTLDNAFRAVALNDEPGDPSHTTADHVNQIMTHQRDEISDIYAQRCLLFGDRSEMSLGELNRKILALVDDRTVSRSSKTSERIAQEVRESYDSLPQSVVAIRHPLAKIMTEMSIAHGGLVGLAEVREVVVSNLARSLYNEKHYETDGEAVRKAEHLFASLSEGLDQEGVRRYVAAYIDAIGMSEETLADAKMASRIKDFGAPTQDVTPDDLLRHKRSIFDDHIRALSAREGALQGKVQGISDGLELSHKEVAPEKLVRALFADPTVALQLYEKAIFSQPGDVDPKQSEHYIMEQLRPLMSGQLELFSEQKRNYDSIGAFARAFKSKEQGSDPGQRLQEWLENAASQFMIKLQDRQMQTPRLHLDYVRNALGNVDAVAPQPLNQHQQLTHTAQRLHQAQANYKRLESNITGKIILGIRAPGSSPDAGTLLSQISLAEFTALYKGYYSQLSAPSGSDDWAIQLSGAITKALGRESPSRYLNSTDAKERARVLTEKLVDEFARLGGGPVRLEQMRDEAQQLRGTWNVDEMVLARVKRLEAYDHYTGRPGFDPAAYDRAPE